MLKNISIGQYFPGDSPVHRLDARMKLVLATAYIVLLFLASNFYSLLVGAAMLLVLYPLSKIPAKAVLRSMKPVIPIILFTAILNMFFVQGDVLFKLGFLQVTSQGIMTAIIMAGRILCLIAGSSLLMYTTSPIMLTDAIERLFSPLRRFHVPVHEIAMMMTIALRFIPTLIEETDKIMSAQKARGADMESGNIIQRVQALIPILIPLFVSAFRRADELALAMECRCYHGGDGRTRMRQLQMSHLDVIGAAVMVGCIAAVLAANRLAPAVGLF